MTWRKRKKKIHYEKKYPYAMWLWKMEEYKNSNIVQIDTQTLQWYLPDDSC